MPYSLDSIYRAAQELRDKRKAQEVLEQEELSASLRLWRPPSFDPKVEEVPRGRLPTVEEVESIRAEAHKLGLDAGYEAGFSEGQKDGFAVGHQAGSERGSQEGYEAGYAEAKEEIAQLVATLNELMQAISDFPSCMGEPLSELALQVAEKLAGKEDMDRGPFTTAIHEALTRLPKPGETLHFRIHPRQYESWKKVLEDPGLAFKCTLIADETLADGHAYVEVSGMRLNIGTEARRALVRTALGLDASAK